MHIMYIDESGDTIPLSQGGKKFLVLSGCIIDEINKLKIERKFRIIKEKYYQNPNIEIKSNFLRYANPDLSEKSPIKLKDRRKYDELEKDVSDFLKEIPCTIILSVINKENYWEKYPSLNPYNEAYISLLERFQLFLEQNNTLGIVIIDPREGQVEKHFIGEELDSLHNKLRWDNDIVLNNCSRVVEKVLFSASDATVGIQIADLYCYPAFHIFEYNKKANEYWRFNDLTFPKLYKLNGCTQDIGLAIFSESKKDL